MIINQPRLLCVTMYLCVRACVCVCVEGPGKCGVFYCIAKPSLATSRASERWAHCCRKTSGYHYNVSITTHSLCVCLWLVLLTVCVFFSFSPTLLREHAYFCVEVFLVIHSFKHYLDFTVSSFGKAMYCLHMRGGRRKKMQRTQGTIYVCLKR